MLTYGDHEGNVDPADPARPAVVDVAFLRQLHAQLVALAAADAVVVEDAAVVEGRVAADGLAAGGIVGEAANIYLSLEHARVIPIV